MGESFLSDQGFVSRSRWKDYKNLRRFSEICEVGKAKSDDEDFVPDLSVVREQMAQHPQHFCSTGVASDDRNHCEDL